MDAAPRGLTNSSPGSCRAPLTTELVHRCGRSSRSALRPAAAALRSAGVRVGLPRPQRGGAHSSLKLGPRGAELIAGRRNTGLSHLSATAAAAGPRVGRGQTEAEVGWWGRHRTVGKRLRGEAVVGQGEVRRDSVGTGNAVKPVWELRRKRSRNCGEKPGRWPGETTAIERSSDHTWSVTLAWMVK